MDVTLAGALVTAALDPALIFGLRLGLEGAAASTICSRLAIAALGWHGVTRAHALVGPLRRATLLADCRAVLGVAGPAVLTNRDPGGRGVRDAQHGAVRRRGRGGAGDDRPHLAGRLRPGLRP